MVTGAGTVAPTLPIPPPKGSNMFDDPPSSVPLKLTACDGGGIVIIVADNGGTATANLAPNGSKIGSSKYVVAPVADMRHWGQQEWHHQISRVFYVLLLLVRAPGGAMVIVTAMPL